MKVVAQRVKGMNLSVHSLFLGAQPIDDRDDCGAVLVFQSSAFYKRGSPRAQTYLMN